jgi:hypothetical protein
MYQSYCIYQQVQLMVMVFNATFINITVISWWSVLLMEEARVLIMKNKLCSTRLCNTLSDWTVSNI